MKDTQYIHIQGWMVNVLKLKSTELIIYAIVYGFSQDSESKFTGSIKYLQSCSGSSRNTVINSLKKLLEKQFIMKLETTLNGVKFCSYSHNAQVVQKLTLGSAKIGGGGSANFAPNNTNNNNTNNISNQNTKILFSNSDYNNLENVRNKLLENKKNIEKYNGVDLEFYIESVLNWSDSSNTKRTNKGWIATIKTFMNKDILSNKLVKKLKTTKNKKVSIEEAREKGVHFNH